MMGWMAASEMQVRLTGHKATPSVERVRLTRLLLDRVMRIARTDKDTGARHD